MVNTRCFRSSLTRALGRRSAGLCLGIAVVLTALLVSGPGVTAVGMAVAIVVSAVADRSVRAFRWRRSGARSPRSTPTMLGLVVLGWALVAAVAVVAPAGSVIHFARELHRMGGSTALVPARAHLVLPSPVLLDLLVGGGLVCSLFAVRSLRRPESIEGSSCPESFMRARVVVSEYGEDSLAPFILRPDKSFEFSGDGVVAYRMVGETVVVSADPVGPEGAGMSAFEQLLGRARRAGLGIAVYGASERHLGAYRALGLHAMQVGEEAVVDPAAFSLDGRRVRKLRQSVHRVERRGWRIVVREGRDIDCPVEAEIDAVEATWRATRERMLGFAMSMGEFEPGVRPDDIYALAWSPDGELCAVMRFVSHTVNLSLDTMRRVGETPNGLNEALVCHALEFARARGVREVSLNYAGLGHLVRERRSGSWLSRTLTGALIRVLQGRFQMDRLVIFNAKFIPRWRPRYLIYESRAGLPRCMLRVLQAEGYIPQRETKRAGRDVGHQVAWPTSAAVKEELTG